jgi:hypothetical protein
MFRELGVVGVSKISYGAQMNCKKLESFFNEEDEEVEK